MLQKSAQLMGCTAVVAMGLSSSARAAINVDGTLDVGQGYQLVSTQTNITNDPTSQNGGDGGPSSVVGTSVTNINQISNAYAKIDTGTNTLYLFLGGSFTNGASGVTHYAIALDYASGGVSNLNGKNLAGGVFITNNPGSGGSVDDNNTGVRKINFDTGFTPNGFLFVQPTTPGVNGGTSTGTAAYTGFTDLTGGAASTAITVGLNNALIDTSVGTSELSDFTAATTGTEIAIPLSSLGWDGNAINVSVFSVNGGSDGRVNNQVLAPFAYGGAGSGFDYTYIDGPPGNGGNPRQFTGAAYPGLQFFTIPVPEPTTLGLLAFAGLPLLSRRKR